MSRYDQRPWLARYDTGQPHDIEVEFGSVLEMFGATVQRDPDRAAIRYFDGALAGASWMSCPARSPRGWPTRACRRASGWRCSCRTCRSSSSP